VPAPLAEAPDSGDVIASEQPAEAPEASIPAPEPKPAPSALVRPVMGRLGRGGLSVPAERKPESAPPATKAPRPSGSLSLEELQAAWMRATEAVTSSRIQQSMRRVTAGALRGNTFVVLQPAEGAKLAQMLVSDPKQRMPVEAALSGILGFAIRLEMEAGAERLGVQVLPAHAPPESHASQPEREETWEAPPASYEDAADGAFSSDAELVAALQQAAPPSEKLQKLLDRDEEMRRAVGLLCQLTKGRVTRINGEPL